MIWSNGAQAYILLNILVFNFKKITMNKGVAMKKIGILTSGGDAPGMNAVINGVVTAASELEIEVVGFVNGYDGLINNEVMPLPISYVKQINALGGTVLGTARSAEFMKPEVREETIARLKAEGFAGLVVIGGDGSYKGAKAIMDLGLPVVALPGTIDNDIPMTDATIGFRTALNNVMDSVDRIVTSAASHGHNFAIEVMGRHAGDIALWSGLALDADVIITDKAEFEAANVVTELEKSKASGKKYRLIIIAEGAMTAEAFKEIIEAESDFKIHPLLLGHIQRGGMASLDDRIMGKLYGEKAVHYFENGGAGCCMGIQKNQIVIQDLTDVLSAHKEMILPFGYTGAKYRLID